MSPSEPRPKKLLDQVRETIQLNELRSPDGSNVCTMTGNNIDHRSVRMRLLGSDNSNRLHSDPSAVSDKPVADKRLVLDHNGNVSA